MADSSLSSSTEIDGVEFELVDGRGNPEVGNGASPTSGLPMLAVILPSGHHLDVLASSVDVVQVLRGAVQDSREGCLLTNFHFVHNGRRLHELATFEQQHASLQDGDKIFVVPEPYSEQSARAHVSFLAELLRVIPAAYRDEAPSVLSLLSNPKVTFDGIDLKKDDYFGLSLSKFLPVPTPRDLFFHQLNYSGWNPPTNERKLHGDLFYLDVLTLEGQYFCVTAWVNGFYVNQSTHMGTFNPTPSVTPAHAHELSELLRTISPIFAKRLAAHLKSAYDPKSLDYRPVFLPAVSWLGRSQSHTWDSRRAEDALVQSASGDNRVEARSIDWTEQMRIVSQKPTETYEQQFDRVQQLYALHTEFVRAAREGAVRVVEGNVPPLVADDADRRHWAYLYNNIFFSQGFDGKGLFKDHGGDATAFRNASNEIIGTKLLARASPKNAAAPTACVVDYMGQRLLCQGLLPGLYSVMMSGSVTPILYGGPLSEEELETMPGSGVEFDSELARIVEEEVAPKLHLKTHVVLDKDGKEYRFATHSDTKGMKGSDGKYYLVDLAHPTPRDLNYPDRKDSAYIIRPELIEQLEAAYISEERTKLLKEVQTISSESPKLRKFFPNFFDESPPSPTDGTESGDSSSSDQTNEKPILTPELEAKKDRLGLLIESITSLKLDQRYNCDVGYLDTLGGTEEERAEDLAKVKGLAEHLLEVVQNFSHEFVLGHISAIDSYTLKKLMHGRGINMRYLGRIASTLNKLAQNQIAFARRHVGLLEREMVLRVSRHILDRLLYTAPGYLKATVTIAFLNAYFGAAGRSGAKPGLGVDPNSFPWSFVPETPAKDGAPSQSLPTTVEIPFLPSLTVDKLWARIRADIAAKYDYVLPDVLNASLLNASALRELCIRNGIQIRCRDYDLAKESPFQDKDLVKFYPRIKHAEPNFPEADRLHHLAAQQLQMGRTDVAYELLQECLASYYNVYGGHMHENVAIIFSALGELQLNAGASAEAVNSFETAAVICERVYGLDHSSTLHAYTNLAFSLRGFEQTSVIVNYFKRALFLGQIVGGSNQPEYVINLVNYASTLQESGQLEESRLLLLRALGLAEKVFGAHHPQVAAIHHALALLHYFVGSFREALAEETLNYEILNNNYGQSHPLTQESNVWLKNFTSAAVSKAKNALNFARANKLPLSKPLASIERAVFASPDLSSKELAKFTSAVMASQRPVLENRISVATGASWSGEVLVESSATTSSASNDGASKKKVRRGGKKKKASAAGK